MGYAEVYVEWTAKRYIEVIRGVLEKKEEGSEWECNVMG